MFAQLQPASARRQRWLALASLAAHALILAWLLHPPAPQRIEPRSVLLGKNGSSVTRLYWSSKTPDDSKNSSADAATERYQHERLGAKLAYQKPPEFAKLPKTQAPVTPAEKEDNSTTQTLSAQGHGAQAGSSYGSMYRGSLSGDDVRPALPTTTSDPVVYPWQLPDYGGNEVIEITIDRSGAIVDKKVLVSLGPDIDSKCLAALDNWHFQPATRNGAPIASKQDAVFPFRARG
jgi:outer membrane biosynthesis protein TonB